jgi:hypothetical protein
MFKRAMTVLASVCVLALVGCSSTQEVRSGALANGHSNDADEQVTLEQCPPAVQATIKQHAGGAPIVEIERTTDHGEVLFEVDAQGSDGIFEFDVAENGEFRGMEADDDDGDQAEDDDADDEDEDGDVQVALADCPPAVQATIAQYVGKGTINEIERSPADNYEVDANGPDGQFEFVVAGDGTYLGPEDDDGDDDDDD